MKINNNISSINSNSTIQKLDNIDKKTPIFEQSSLNQLNNFEDLTNNVMNNVNSIKGSFQLQENYSIIQQKQNLLNEFQNSNLSLNDLQNATFNSKPLFNLDELSRIKTDLNSLLNEYETQSQQIRNNLNSYMVANENSNALNVEKDIERITQYIQNSTSYNLNYNAANVIDLLK
ncbi:MAG: hypothetical protein N3A58_01855 [Spirochaetes bacterium]|nr:hypothetical protein [Spirochaetota bacterium]